MLKGQKITTHTLALIFTIWSGICFAQNQTSKWYFGNGAALDFMTAPPTPLSGSSMSNAVGCSSIADATGNLLFYTDGATIYNSTHSVMANGTGLSGNSGVGQTSLIVKKPGSQNLYFVFTVHNVYAYNGLCYSIIDMSLAAGQGSVTVKNVVVYSGNAFSAISGIKHCNSFDYWIVIKDWTASSKLMNFRAYLLTVNGLVTQPVISPAWSPLGLQPSAWWHPDGGGPMKISPQGKKLAISIDHDLEDGGQQASNFSNHSLELYDFDVSTGLVSNCILLSFNGSTAENTGYGCEFSPDGTKLFSTNDQGSSNALLQWDLCAGASSAIASSEYSVYVGNGMRNLQLALDGSIYVVMGGGATQSLSVINNPNNSGATCNFSLLTQDISPGKSFLSLPNFCGSDFLKKQPLSPFTHTLNMQLSCNTVSFTASATQTAYGCAASGFTLLGTTWNFNDPGSGSANNSTLNNPNHAFSGPGTYTPYLVYHYSCGGGTDTVRKAITITTPTVGVNTSTITCASLGTGTMIAGAGIGPYTYTWMPANVTGSIGTGLIPGNHTLTVFDAGLSCQITKTVYFAPLIPLTGNALFTDTIYCYGVSSGTGAIVNLAGGSGNQFYNWFNGSSTFTNATPNSLSAGLWSVTVTDALTACQVNEVFYINQYPVSNINVASSSPTACVGYFITLTGTTSGGAPGYSYAWTGGPNYATNSVTENIGGVYVYSLNSTDSKSCTITNTISVQFISSPSLTVSNTSICPLQTGVLTASGASNYTWSTGSTQNSISATPVSTTVFTVLGEALGCIATTTASIILKPLPVAIVSSNSPGCENGILKLFAFGGSSYYWTGPLGYSATLQNLQINNLTLTHAGVYQVTVTGANSCTNSTSTSVVVNQNPTVSAIGSTVCTIQTATLTSNSIGGISYQWFGPGGYFSTQQNPTLLSPSLNTSGNYTVKAISAQGCTNSAVVQLLVVLPPPLTAQLSSHSLCSQAFNGSPNTITLTAGGANTYTLVTVPDLFNANPSGPVSPLSNIPPNVGVASATLSGSNGVCTITLGLTFTIIPNPTVSVNSHTPQICAGQSFTYTNNGANSYTWNAGTPNFTTTAVLPSLTQVSTPYFLFLVEVLVVIVPVKQVQ